MADAMPLICVIVSCFQSLHSVN